MGILLVSMFLLFPLSISFPKSLYTLHIGVNTEGRGVNNIVEEKNTFLNSCAQCKFSMILVTNPNQFHFWYCLLYLDIWKHISPIELWVGTI